MFDFFSSLNQFNLVWIVIPSIVLVVSFFIFIFIRRGKNSYEASDGSILRTNEELLRYELILNKLNIIFNQDQKDNKDFQEIGLDFNFVDVLKNKGFSEPKILIKYRKELNIISDILNQP